ncbi:hypothetical protein [Legionella waltersii]|uniref:Uncharacterized protein n=1 Tax=Legionella waltersii TaxID=66969 RepID=A0A0W1A154_9GAMM|nr:hypothetical protein [Legionella waltersii]KTD74953.1 hypothetical protein Lwal_2994 [Legionella waltersii]SNV08520.1 Uncharacterised protein [Legionella waltersii]
MKKEKLALHIDPLAHSRASSTALTLQQLNKEKEKKDTAEETVKVRCKICFKEIAPIPRCFGHGGGAGGGGTDSENAAEKNDKQDNEPPFNMDDQFAVDHEELMGELNRVDTIEIGEELDPEDRPDDNSFDPDVIAELVAKDLLLINPDRKSMTLTIELQCDLKTLSKEQRKELKTFMNAIKKEFNAFKEQHHLSDECIQVAEDEKGNLLSLRINLPKVALYDAFIQQLAAHLQPRPSLNSRNKDEPQINGFEPNPLSMKPNPSSKIKEHGQGEMNQNQYNTAEKVEPQSEESVVFNPSPLSIDLKRW